MRLALLASAHHDQLVSSLLPTFQCLLAIQECRTVVFRVLFGLFDPVAVGDVEHVRIHLRVIALFAFVPMRVILRLTCIANPRGLAQ